MNHHVADSSNQLIIGLQKELGYESTDKTMRSMCVVINQLKRWIPYDNGAMFTVRMPDYLRLLFLPIRPNSPLQKKFGHLDEFVEDVFNSDQQNQRVFSTEVAALSFILAFLRRLDVLFNLSGIEPLPKDWRYALQKAIVEEI